ncbi:MAG: glycosyltransferase family 4 protein [Candidatus Sumerlaeia bacterium]|nr:glycosyltransferase family 4 protein [Candidatus Sumerlaeia bacterium]
MPKALRILHIDTEKGFRGGERQVSLLAHGLRDLGHKQLIAGPEGSKLNEHLSEKGFQVANWKPPLFLGARSPFLSAWLSRVAGDFNADIIHAHTGNGHTAAVHTFIGKRPLITTRRVDFAIKDNALSKAKYTRPGQHYIAISKAVRDVLVEGGVRPEVIDLVYSGIDTGRVEGGDRAKLRGEWLAGSEGPIIGFVGAFADHKAPWVLAHAARMIREELPGARIIFVGDGEFRALLEEISADIPDAIHLAGWREDIADCLAAFDLFVMPSKLEGLCTSLIDALAAGVPCVSTNAGGIPEVIVDGKTGVLVPPKDEEALARAVVALWRDPDGRERYRQAGFNHVGENFTADAMVRGTLEVYNKVLGNK